VSAATTQAWKSFEKKNFKAQAEFEKKIVNTLTQDSGKAIKLITDHTAQKATEVFEKAGELLKSFDRDYYLRSQ
jgi:hypothetical protein